MLKKLAGILSVSALIGAGVVFAILATPDHDEVPTNVISADSEAVIDLSVTPTSALLTATAMGPGDVVQGQMNLTNNTSIAVFVDISTTHTNPPFAAELVMAIQPGSCGTPGVNPDGSANGANIFFGPYSTAGVLAVWSVGAGGVENLCLSVGMPSGILFSTVAGQSDDATIILDTDDLP
jgi:hypothetical protein